MSLDLRQWPIASGAAAGAVGSALALGALSGLGSWLGWPLGLVCGASAGGVAAWLSARSFRRTLLDVLQSPAEDGLGLPHARFGHPELDELLDSMKQSLGSLRRLQVENLELERLTRSSWGTLQGGEAAAGPKGTARQCVVGLLDELRQATAQLVRHTVALEDANERVASGAIDQSETVARTTFTVESLSDKIDRISQNAENANEACERTRQEARRGLEQVHRVIEGMDRLRAQIESNGRKARRLGDRSVEIGTIVELIRGISSRTDMLALNATIESVRAGEHGRGFAVVAEEIRKLAERTAAATGEIGTLVEAIQADAHESLRALGEEQGEMEQEVHRVRETGSALERISQVAEHSATLVEGISRSSNDQVLAAQEMVRAMQRISEVSHLTLEGTNQARESLRGISQCCERLQPLSTLETAAAGPNPGDDPSAASPHHRRRRSLATSERST
jgi:twitching motility protein PilJ